MTILEKIKTQKIIGLAPMAGYTDSAFRQMCKQFGADLVYTEMVSADGVYYDWLKRHKKSRLAKSLELAKFEKNEKPIFVQIFGKDPQKMAAAAKILVDKYNPDGIDINMGCPAHKVIASFHGASLMRDSELAAKIVTAVKSAIGKKTLSVKTRLGWEDKAEILKFAPMLEKAGADLLAIHCRTKIQGFAGDPDWEAISSLKNLIKIPFFVNGKIIDYKSASRCIKESGANGLLIGQAAIGRLWIFEEIKKQKIISKNFSQIEEISMKHAKLYKKNSKNGSIVPLRKQLISYWKSFKDASLLRQKIVTCETVADYQKALKTFSECGRDDRDDEDKN